MCARECARHAHIKSTMPQVKHRRTHTHTLHICLLKRVLNPLCLVFAFKHTHVLRRRAQLSRPSTHTHTRRRHKVPNINNNTHQRCLEIPAGTKHAHTRRTCSECAPQVLHINTLRKPNTFTYTPLHSHKQTDAGLQRV